MFVDEKQTFYSLNFRIKLKLHKSIVFLQNSQYDLSESVFIQRAIFNLFLTL